MFPKVVSVPFRIGLSATRMTLGLSAKLAGVIAGDVVKVVQSRFASPAPAPAPEQSPAPPTEPPASPASVPDPAISVVVAVDVAPLVEKDLVAPDEPPDTPLTRQAADVKTIDDADEVVAEFAEPGAEDGAGAQLTVEEPWAGYDSETAAVITEKIAAGDAAVLAFLELYEQTHKQRKTVLDAAARRLREISA